MKPSIGRIVHLVDTNGSHQAAIITYVWCDTTVNLQVFPDNSTPYAFTSSVADEKAALTGSWHWPEKV